MADLSATLDGMKCPHGERLYRCGQCDAELAGRVERRWYAISRRASWFVLGMTFMGVFIVVTKWALAG